MKIWIQNPQRLGERHKDDANIQNNIKVALEIPGNQPTYKKMRSQSIRISYKS